ncbi:MAG: DUF721 domain-containing protein [Thermotogota bacterium]|nr:DUF721 domain-containing protein [Thermotogota bacterium]
MKKNYKIMSEVMDILSKKNYIFKNLKVKSTLNKEWENIFGKTVSKHCRVKDFDNDLLTIVADDGVWKSELLLRKGQILSKINKALGTRLVKNIRIGSGK